MQTSFCTAKKEIVIVYNTPSKKLIAPLRDNYKRLCIDEEQIPVLLHALSRNFR